jgi:hypothetical protein
MPARFILDWKLYKNTITKLMCDKFGATKVHTSKGSMLTFDPDKLAKIDRLYNAEIKIKTTLEYYVENEGNITSETSRDATPENGGDGGDGCDGSRDSDSDINDDNAMVVIPSIQAELNTDFSRDSAYDINDNNVKVVTAANLQEISPNTVEEGQGTVSRAVTAITSAESGNNTIHTQGSIPHTTIALQQTSSETIQNARDILVRC